MFLYALTISMAEASFANGDTTKQDNGSYFEKYQSLINAGKVPFYGTWSDYFSSYLKINQDSTFHFSWGYNGRNCGAAGRWERKKDTFYFIRDPGKMFPAHTYCPLPDKLCFYRNKFYLVDSSGNLRTGKIPSAYMGKKSPFFKTFYFREKRFNLDYFDSSYYHRNIKQVFRFGIGIDFVIQPIPSYPTAFSFGFALSPRFIFERKEKSYLSLGLPMVFGFTGIRDTTSIDPHAGPMIDLPVIFNYNYSFGSLKQGGSRFEYFAGGGAAYHYNIYSISKDPSVGRRQTNGFGPVANAGIRYYLGRYRIRNFELKFSYMRMIVASKTHIIGTGLLLNF